MNEWCTYRPRSIGKSLELTDLIQDQVKLQMRHQSEQLDMYIVNMADALGLTIPELAERFELYERQESEPVPGSDMHVYTWTWRLRQKPRATRRVSAVVHVGMWGYVVRILTAGGAEHVPVGDLGRARWSL